MSYFLLYGVFALWVFLDSFSRRMGASGVIWALGTAVLGPIVLPVYLALRPLKQGEVREGGKAWHILKNFAILWTIVMVIATIAGLTSMAGTPTSLTSDAEKIGAGLGMLVGMGVLAAVWLFPTMGAALLAFLLKKNTVIETGPTGPMVGSESHASIINGWAGILGAAAIGVVVLGISSSKPATSSVAPEHGNTVTGTEAKTAAEWRVQDERKEIDGTREVSLVLDSENEVPGFIESHKAYLGIRCSKGKPEVYVSVGGPFESIYGDFEAVSVRLKLDDAVPVRQRWIESTNHEAAFASSPTKLVKQLTTSNNLLFEFTPFEKRETTVNFALRDLKGKLEPYTDVCGVKR